MGKVNAILKDIKDYYKENYYDFRNVNSYKGITGLLKQIKFNENSPWDLECRLTETVHVLEFSKHGTIQIKINFLDTFILYGTVKKIVDPDLKNLDVIIQRVNFCLQDAAWPYSVSGTGRVWLSVETRFPKMTWEVQPVSYILKSGGTMVGLIEKDTEGYISFSTASANYTFSSRQLKFIDELRNLISKTNKVVAPDMESFRIHPESISDMRRKIEKALGWKCKINGNRLIYGVDDYWNVLVFPKDTFERNPYPQVQFNWWDPCIGHTQGWGSCGMSKERIIV